MTALVPHGVSRRAYAAKVRRLKGTTPAQRATAQQRAAECLTRRRQRFAKTCGRGHRWTAENTYHSVRKTGPQAGQYVRICKACQQMAEGQRRWRRVVVAKLDRLRVAMLNAHPDRGGSSAQFLKARRQYLAAKAA